MDNTLPSPDNNQAPHGQPWAPPPLPPQQQQWAPPPAYYLQPGPPQVKPRSPALHAIASAVIPGLGTILGGAVGRGILILLILAIVGVLRFIPFLGLPFIPLWFIGWVWAIYDGHRTAREWNARHGIIS